MLHLQLFRGDPFHPLGFRFRVAEEELLLPDEQKKVIALTSYAGKAVKGVAVCSEHDEFDVEVGKRLASARANVKVAMKRKARAEKKLAYFDKIIDDVEREYHELEAYLYTADERWENAIDELANVLNDVGALEPMDAE